MKSGPYKVVRSKFGYFNKVVYEDTTVISVWSGAFGAYYKALAEAEALNGAHLMGMSTCYSVIESQQDRSNVADLMKQIHDSYLFQTKTNK